MILSDKGATITIVKKYIVGGLFMRRTCPRCGAVYELAECKTIMRDKDSLECNFCNETLIKWNGASFWIIEEVVKEPDKLK